MKPIALFRVILFLPGLIVRQLLCLFVCFFLSHGLFSFTLLLFSVPRSGHLLPEFPVCLSFFPYKKVFARKHLPTVFHF